MSLSVADRARRIGTFRFVEVRLMEITAGWTPSTPEMEAKVMFGRHIWDFAQHADALGRRMFELRQPAQRSFDPAPAYVKLMTEVAAVEDTAGRLAALYDVLLDGVQRQYRRYAEDVDAMLDAPSLVVVERILADGRRQREDADRLRRDLELPFSSSDGLRARASATEMVAASGA
jgi:hypothetical protein